MSRCPLKLKIITVCLIGILTITCLIPITSIIDTTKKTENDNSFENAPYLPSSAPLNPIWTYTYNGPSDGDSQFESVIQLSNGDFVATGSQITIGGLDWFTIKTDDNGGGADEGQDWTNSRGSSSSESALSITQATVGDDVVATGYYIDDEEDISLKRLDNTGTNVWTRIYSEPNIQKPKQIIACSSGGFAIVGSYQFSTGAPPNAYILRTYDTGYENWRNKIRPNY